jgi:hypothetical protein
MKRFLSDIKRALGDEGEDGISYLTYFCPTCNEVFELMFHDPIEDYECIDAACEGDLCLIQAKA